MNILTSIGQIITRIPPFKIVYAFESGVYYRFGKVRDTLDAGFYWKIPIIDDIKTLNRREQVVDIPEQGVKGYVISATLSYIVTDPDLAINHVYDFDQSLCNLTSRMILKNAMKQMDYMYIIDRTFKNVHEKAQDWGIEILDFGLNQFTEAIVIHTTRQLQSLYGNESGVL